MDRRVGRERRSEERLKVAVEIEWAKDGVRYGGSLSDINANGCFLLSSGSWTDGDLIKIYFPLTNGETIQIFGEILNHVDDVGFGLRFVNLTDTHKQFLRNFGEHHSIGM